MPLPFTQLKRRYRERGIVLYAGAGVSLGDRNSDTQFFGWWDLLAEILARNGGSAADDLRLRQMADPWAAADFVQGRCGSRTCFQHTLQGIVRDRLRFPKPRGQPGSPNAKKQLGRRFLSQNQTLNAVLALCGYLVARSRTSGPRIQLRARPNPRVRAVLTANYDCFLEAGSSSKYKLSLLKPVAAYGSDVGRLTQIPVFHIHGYVPHPDQRLGVPRRAFLEELVLDSKSYDEAWRSDDPFKFTMQAQIHLLRHHTALFVGFSFTDPRVTELLTTLQAERDKSASQNPHFALVLRDSQRITPDYERLGVVPIECSSPPDICRKLEALHRSGLDADNPDDVVRLPWVAPKSQRPLSIAPWRFPKNAYWNALWYCRNTALSADDLRTAPDYETEYR